MKIVIGALFFTLVVLFDSIQLSVQMNNEDDNNFLPRPRMEGPHILFASIESHSPVQINHTCPQNRIVFPHTTSINFPKRITYTEMQFSDGEDKIHVRNFYDEMHDSLRWGPAPRLQAPHPPAPGQQAPHPPAPRPQAPQPPAVRPQAPRPPALHPPEPPAPQPSAPRSPAPQPPALRPQAPHPPAPHSPAPRPQAPQPPALRPQAPQPPELQRPAPQPPAPRPPSLRAQALRPPHNAQI